VIYILVQVTCDMKRTIDKNKLNRQADNEQSDDIEQSAI